MTKNQPHIPTIRDAVKALPTADDNPQFRQVIALFVASLPI